MAIVGKVLGQIALPATTLTDVYEVPAGTEASVSTVNVCNRSATDRTFRLSVAVAGEADDPKQYLAYDTVVPANDSIPVRVGMLLAETDVIRAYASTTDLSINVFGQEKS